MQLQCPGREPGKLDAGFMLLLVTAVLYKGLGTGTELLPRNPTIITPRRNPSH